MVSGDKGIDLFRWVSLLTTLKLQAETGMRPNRRINPRLIAKEWTGLKTNNFDRLIAAVEVEVAKRRAQVTHVYEDVGPTEDDPPSGGPV